MLAVLGEGEVESKGILPVDSARASNTELGRVRDARNALAESLSLLQAQKRTYADGYAHTTASWGTHCPQSGQHLLNELGPTPEPVLRASQMYTGTTLRIRVIHRVSMLLFMAV